MKKPLNSNGAETNIVVFETAESTDNTLKIAIPDLPYNFIKVGTPAQLTQTMNENDIALTIVNGTGDTSKMATAVKTAKEQNSEMNILVIADTGKQDTIDKLAAAGASDFLTRPVAASLLMSKIRQLCELTHTKKELLQLKQQVAMNYAFDNFIGASADIQKIKRTIQNVINSNTPIILSGQDGTGKNLLAKIIHYHSSRRNAGISEIDCSAVTTAQLQTEMFGNTTTLDNAELNGGLFRRGGGGTVLIDKFHLIDDTIKTRIQTLISSHRGSGGVFKSNGAEMRLIITVNEPLYDLYQTGTIDRQMIDSLGAVEIHLPPLSQRPGDVELLAGYFLRMIAYENDSETLSITPAAIEMLKTHHWPGNVRELENCIRRAVVLCSNNVVDISDVSFISEKIELNRMAGFMREPVSGGRSLAENQRFLITNALDANDWNFTQTAKQLGIGRTTLWRKVRKYKLTKE